MSLADIIQLLPDSVANQIAAGEVVQRPASVVKELIENAVDADSTQIKLIIKDAGKTLVQVIDNGKGMSETDARLSFERHATSKLKTADDLFAIKTKGFRGEALASIAAIAHVELKTKRPVDETGTLISIEGSKITTQEPCSCSTGTSIAVKNLFFNVPARRNFLKSNSVEKNHIIDEFLRVALAHPNIAFYFYDDEVEEYRLEIGSLRQRIVAIFGNNYNERLVPLEEESSIVSIHGFVGKPEFAKKTRGEQFFFINNRFIKSAYLNHAVQNAFEHLLSRESHPSFFIFLNVDPSFVDVNIHPTKTEVKFEDDKSIYAVLRTTVKMALGKNNITPTLDFDQEQSINFDYKPKDGIARMPQIRVNPNYNPFDSENNKGHNFLQNQNNSIRNQSNKSNWEKLYESHQNETETSITSSSFVETIEPTQEVISSTWKNDSTESVEKPTIQIHNAYIISPIKSGFMIIYQQHAHERILYERILNNIENQTAASQQLLFPETFEFNSTDAALLNELLPEIKTLGFDMDEFGKNTFVVNGCPVNISESQIKPVLEEIIEQFKNNSGGADLKLSRNQKLALSMAQRVSIKAGKHLETSEVRNLIDELFACQMPYSTPTGKTTFITYTNEELEKKFKI